MKGQGKPQSLLQDDSSPLQRSKYLPFLPIGPLWHLSRNVIVASARGHLLPRDQLPGGRGSAVNALVPSHPHGALPSPARAGWVLTARSHNCVPVTWARILAPGPPCLTGLWPACRATYHARLPAPVPASHVACRNDLTLPLSFLRCKRNITTSPTVKLVISAKCLEPHLPGTQ